MSEKFSVVSMFSGCGGMDLGLLGGFSFLGKRYKRLPFEIVWANELNTYAAQTYAHNLGHEPKVGDVWKHFDTLPETADLIVGGFPCQDISINGKRAGVAGERSGLYRAMVRAVEKIQPRMFVAENVRSLLYAYNKDSLDTVLRDFSNLGYDVNLGLYHAADYGVPQRRERVFIVGTMAGIEFEHPEPFLDKSSWITSMSAICDLEDMETDTDFSHIWSLAKKSSDQGGRMLNPNSTAHTVRAECHGNNQFHYSLPRRISMREAARFQTFPDNFLFKARLRETERMIGNAVPPVLAWHIARSLAASLSNASEADRLANDKLKLSPGGESFAAE